MQDKSPLMWTNNQVRAGVRSIEARGLLQVVGKGDQKGTETVRVQK